MPSLTRFAQLEFIEVPDEKEPDKSPALEDRVKKDRGGENLKTHPPPGPGGGPVH